ncbi:UPF0462 protein C4orf33 [Trichonephila clavipes]|nr:UPF0462 protein C4orf33 [Trichonephila clavipes]
MCLPVEYQATINQQNNTWRGIASIPKTYFPPGVNRFNAYAIHGSGDGRQYEALFPVFQLITLRIQTCKLKGYIQ